MKKDVQNYYIAEDVENAKRLESTLYLAQRWMVEWRGAPDVESAMEAYLDVQMRHSAGVDMILHSNGVAYQSAMLLEPNLELVAERAAAADPGAGQHAAGDAWAGQGAGPQPAGGAGGVGAGHVAGQGGAGSVGGLRHR